MDADARRKTLLLASDLLPVEDDGADALRSFVDDSDDDDDGDEASGPTWTMSWDDRA